jgi:predicted phosphoadenosine phosphosulfate sulfurtransferase
MVLLAWSIILRIYLQQNVYDAALERIRYIFSEFPDVIVNISGGKDSTVIFNLAMIVAEELGRLPLGVMFIDQEAEWSLVIDYVREIMTDPRVCPYWLQIPFRLTNATSVDVPYLYCWDPDKEELWIREKEEISIKENRYGVDRFHDLFKGFINTEFKGRACYLAGVRCEESPGRQLGLMSSIKYKYIPWGKKHGKDHYAFYPLYDWSYKDIWKAIHDHDWAYSRLYDFQYAYGLKINQMRVSSVHHETSLSSLYYMQEVEPDTWDRLTARLQGVATVGQLCEASLCPSQLPYMFSSWREYRDFLLDRLIDDNNIWRTLRRNFDRDDCDYVADVHNAMHVRHINSILTKDIDLSRMGTWRAAHLNYRVKSYAQS